jgi:hypothetical protein
MRFGAFASPLPERKKIPAAMRPGGYDGLVFLL